MCFCKGREHYRCHVYTLTKIKEGIVFKVLDNIIPKPNGDIKLREMNDGFQIEFINGSVIRIMKISEYAKWHRFNGVIIDSDIITQIAREIILSLEEFGVKDNWKERIYYCPISADDVTESEKYKRSLKYVLERMEMDMQIRNNNFEKEYMYMLNENTYNMPIRTVEKDNSKILVFNALGIPKDDITYNVEFVNKTKKSYLVVKGETDLEYVNYKNGINIREEINTDIYSGYDVGIENGLIFIRLHEIANTRPVLVDYGENK